MEGYLEGAAEKASAEVEVTARTIRQMPAVKSLVERCGKAVGWQRLLYRLKLLNVPEGGGGHGSEVKVKESPYGAGRRGGGHGGGGGFYPDDGE